MGGLWGCYCLVVVDGYTTGVGLVRLSILRVDSPFLWGVLRGDGGGGEVSNRPGGGGDSN